METATRTMTGVDFYDETSPVREAIRKLDFKSDVRKRRENEFTSAVTTVKGCHMRVTEKCADCPMCSTCADRRNQPLLKQLRAVESNEKDKSVAIKRKERCKKDAIFWNEVAKAASDVAKSVKNAFIADNIDPSNVSPAYSMACETEEEIKGYIKYMSE